ncbi:molybdopterin converting factor subunit 1 [Agarivorans sp.]|uniref:molybdopterin converting factor subunit 1 n=1 Tax=Agarivorans sp. TaxID=1872412 RepID=UPI003D044745
MLVKVLFFARLKEQLGEVATQVELADGENSQDLKQQLIARGDKWQALADSSILMAVNQQHISQPVALHNGDEIAFFPPVTGG